MCAVVVAVKLYNSGNVAVTERVCASKMVYYMALAFISNVSRRLISIYVKYCTDSLFKAFMIPFFFVLAFSDKTFWKVSPQTSTLSMVASVAATVSGLMTGGLYLFLKPNTLSTIGPRDKAHDYDDDDSAKPVLRRSNTDRSDVSFTGHMMQPVSGPGSLRRLSSESNAGRDEKIPGPEGSAPPNPLPNPLRSNPSLRIPRTPEPAQMSSMNISHMRKQSYSLFPNGSPNPSQKSSATLLPSTTYTPMATARPVRDAQSALDHLKPPPTFRNLAFGRHRRDSSMISSATVQIGLRLSNVDGITSIPITNHPNTSVTSLGCPNAIGSTSKRPSPVVPPRSQSPSPSPWPPALRLDTSSAAIPDATPRRDPVKSARMKTLPPVPSPGGIVPTSDDDDVSSNSFNDEEDEETAVTLSPTVYDAQSPTKSRDANVKDEALLLPASKFNGSTSPMKPPRRTPIVNDTLPKADWI